MGPHWDQFIDQLLDGCDSPEDILGEAGLLKQLTKKVAVRVLEAEMEAHLGYAPNDSAGNNSDNSRNGKTKKTVRSTNGDVEVSPAFISQVINAVMDEVKAWQHRKAIPCSLFGLSGGSQS